MPRTLEAAGACQCLFKRADMWDNISTGLTVASLIPGIGNVAMPISGVYDATRSAMKGNWGEAGLNLAAGAVGLLGAGYAGKAVQYGGKAALLGSKAAKGATAASKAERAWGAAKGVAQSADTWARAKARPMISGAYRMAGGRGSKFGRGVMQAGKWIGKNPGKAYLGLMGAGMLLGAGGGAEGEGGMAGEHQTNRIGMATDEAEIKNIAPGLSQTQINMPLLQQSAQQQQIDMPHPVAQAQQE